MANPQAEDGHIDIANEIAEKLMQIRISGEEWQILWVIFRKTWGWHKKTDHISHTQFARLTNLNRRHIGRLIDKLLQKNLITKKGDSFICKYGIQKDWEKWKPSPKKVTVIQKGDETVTKKGDKTVIQKGDDKRNKEKKESNNTKSPLQLGGESQKQIDALVTLYEKRFPQQRKLWGVGAVIKIRERIEGAYLEGITLAKIKARIEEADDGSPFSVISSRWIKEEKDKIKAIEGRQRYEKLKEHYKQKGK